MKRYIPIILISILCASFCLAQELGDLFRVSQTSSGDGGEGASDFSYMSPNAPVVVFQSGAPNLVTGDLNSSTDIFAKNLTTGETKQLSVNKLGLGGDDDSLHPVISQRTPNGFFAIAFASDAENLARKIDFQDTNNERDIFVHFLNSGMTERISFGPGLVETDGGSDFPSIAVVPAPNRLLVAYNSNATNLTSTPDTNNDRDIYLATMTAPGTGEEFSLENNVVTTRVSKSAVPGVETDGDSNEGFISGDGRFIVFKSEASNLIAGQVISNAQIYIYDVESKETSLVSKSPSGEPGNDRSRNPSISFNGSFVMYLTTSTNILNDGITVPLDTVQVVRYNVKTGESTRVNVTSSGTPGNGDDLNAVSAVVSPNGRFAIFSDSASNLVSGDENDGRDVFAKDFEMGNLVRVSRSFSGLDTDGESTAPTIATNGFTSLSVIDSFTSNATNLILDDTEGRIDVFNSTITFPKLPFAKGDKLEVPPDVEPGSSSATLTLETFDGVAPKAATGSLLNARSIQAAKKKIIKYRIKIHRETDSGKKTDRQEKLSKRNRVSFKKLKPGNYSSRYRVEVHRKDNDDDDDDRPESSSSYSPANRFSIP